MKCKIKSYGKRLAAMLLTAALSASLLPAALAGQVNAYHDPAKNWISADNRTNEFDANAVVTYETMMCYQCNIRRSFQTFRVPEYTKTGVTALNHNVRFSDGTMTDGVNTGSTDTGTPGKNGHYTGYHWSKAVCEYCGTINSNMAVTDYAYGKNVYLLYDCAASFTQKLPETVTYAYADSTHHTKKTDSGEYCGFCYGTHRKSDTVLEAHTLENEVLPQLSNGRFAIVEHCADCDYKKTSYVTAKSVVADYYGVVDGQPHTITVSDLSEAGVRTDIRYGSSAEGCTLTSAPNYTDKGQYAVYYEITYTYGGKSMTENGVANVWLHDESETGKCSCGCPNPNCGCTDPNCKGDCCTDQGCGDQHKWTLLDSKDPSCLTLGYDRYLCSACGRIEKRDYENALGHAYQSVVVRDATCETEGKTLEICSRCGDVKTTATPKGAHQYATHTTQASCISPGYTVKECSICGDRQITNITNALPHAYKAHTTPATCETGGHTLQLCDGCGSSFISDHTDALGHAWDKGAIVTDKTCDGSGVTEYHCTRCDAHRLEGNAASGHSAGAAATCTTPQTCTVCGVILQLPTGHTASDWIIDKQPTVDTEGSKHKECTGCGQVMEQAAIDKIKHHAVTDKNGEAVVNGYLVIVTDTDTKAPIAGAMVSLLADGSLALRLPDNRLIDYADQTTITVLQKEDKAPVPAIILAVTDKNSNYSSGKTDAAGQLTIPGTSGMTNENGNATIGQEDNEGAHITLTVKVEHTDTGRPIEGAQVTTGKDGTLLITLPDGADLGGDHQITVTVTDHRKTPQENTDVSVKDDLGNQETGKTDETGKVTVPETPAVKHSAYIVGYPDGTFGPSRSMTRAEAAAIFARLLAEKNGEVLHEVGNFVTPYSDVPVDAWYAGAVKYLTAYNILYGCGNRTFCPNTPITRAEFTAMAVRFFEATGDGNAEIMDKYAVFTDVPNGHWAAEYIHDAALHGWVVGYGDGTFRGDTTITRAEVVTLTNHLLGRKADAAYIAEHLRQLTQFTDMKDTHWAYLDVMESANAHKAALKGSEIWSK